MNRSGLFPVPGWAALLALTASCNLINPAEPVPAYLVVHPYEVQTTPLYGSNSSKITDVYVVVDNVSLGAYPLPATFPVLETGAHEVVLSPGIVVNGISNARGVYPFYNNYSTTVTLASGQETEVTPVTTYRDVTVSWLEDFESMSGISLQVTPSSETGITGFPSGDPSIFEGGNSGRVELDASQSVFDLVTSPDFKLKINTSIFLEINYRCNNAFEVGVVANQGGGSSVRQAVLTINPKETWNKLYVDINPGVVATPGSFDYKIYFTGTRDAAASNAYFYFDNLKLLHD